MAKIVKCPECDWEGDQRGYNGHKATHKKKSPDSETNPTTPPKTENKVLDATQNDPKTQNIENPENVENPDFIQKTQIDPDKKLLTDDSKNEDEQEEYQCGKCGFKWTASKEEYQERCPHCMVEFE